MVVSNRGAGRPTDWANDTAGYDHAGHAQDASSVRQALAAQEHFVQREQCMRSIIISPND